MAALTPARRRALEAMAGVHPRPARYSNVTLPAVPGERSVALVYHQTADWLVEQGLAEMVEDEGWHRRLTAAGLAACREAGIPIRAES